MPMAWGHIFAMILNPDGAPTALVADAKAAGLAVHAWTIRPENEFLPPMLRTGDDPKFKGCGDYRLAVIAPRTRAFPECLPTGRLLVSACAEALPAE